MLAFRGAVDQTPEFVWCPNPDGCESGQMHEARDAEPIVRCVRCHYKFCFRHQREWHEQLTCEEYDAFLEDPGHFRSRLEIENEEVEQHQAEQRTVRRQQEEADRMYAQSLLDADQQEEARRQEQRERAKRQRAEEERAAKELKAKQMRNEAERRKIEEDRSLATIKKTTKQCPGCSWPIEKNKGW